MSELTKIAKIDGWMTKEVATIQNLLPATSPITAEAFITRAVDYCQKNTYLLDKCGPGAIISQLLVCAKLGLEPDGVLGSAHLVPYGSKCQLIVGYRGYIDLARRTGAIKKIEAHVVRSADHFEYEYGTEEKLIHAPQSTDEDEIIAAYAIATLADGIKQFEVMDIEELLKIKAGSSGAKRADSPWNIHFGEMCRKTVVRRLMKYLPLSPEIALAHRAEDQPETITPATVTPESEIIDTDGTFTDLEPPTQTDEILADHEARKAEREAAQKEGFF